MSGDWCLVSGDGWLVAGGCSPRLSQQPLVDGLDEARAKLVAAALPAAVDAALDLGPEVLCAAARLGLAPAALRLGSV